MTKSAPNLNRLLGFKISAPAKARTTDSGSKVGKVGGATSSVAMGAKIGKKTARVR